MTPLLDDIDVKILNHLQEQGRAQRNKIAELVGLAFCFRAYEKT